MGGWSGFRTVRLCLLLETGETVAPDPDRRPVEPRRAGTLALSRALCRFHFFPTPAGLSRRRAAAAARLFAEAHAPFSACDHALFRRPGGVAIWWWDAERVEALAGHAWRYDAGRLVPETLLQPAGDGWRQAATAEGFEAQFWRDGVLRASTWRRRPFTPEQWAAFALSVDEPAPPLPPPQSLPLGAWREARLSPPWGWPQATRWASAAGAAALATSACFAVQAAWYDRRRADALAAADASRTAADHDPGARRAQAELSLVRAFQARSGRSAALTSAAEGLEVFAAFGARPIRWSADGAEFRAELLGPADELPLRDLAAALEERPAFRNVTAEVSDHLVVVSAELGPGPVPAGRA